MTTRLDGGREPLPPLVRSVDAAYAELVATAAPLRHVTFGRTSTEVIQILATTSAARLYARSLAALVEQAEADRESCRGADIPPIRAAAEQLRTSLQALEHRLATGDHDVYVRAAALLVPVRDDPGVPRRSTLGLALKDLTLLDGALAHLAGALQMSVTDHDT